MTDAPEVDTRAARLKAWKTRRQKYGVRGHAGSYARLSQTDLERRALALIVRLHHEEVLSEGQCCQALNMDRVEFRMMCDAA